MVHIPALEIAQDVAARTLPLSRRPIPVCPFVRLEVIPAGVPEGASVRGDVGARRSRLRSGGHLPKRTSCPLRPRCDRRALVFDQQAAELNGSVACLAATVGVAISTALASRSPLSMSALF